MTTRHPSRHPCINDNEEPSRRPPAIHHGINHDSHPCINDNEELSRKPPAIHHNDIHHDIHPHINDTTKNQGVVVLASRQSKNTQLLRFDNAKTRRGLSNAQARSSFLHFDNAKTRRRRGSSFLRFDNAKTRRGLSFVRSRHAKTTQRVMAAAIRHRQNTQRVVDRAITTRRAHAEDHRFCVSTTPKHAEGCRSCHRDTPRPRGGSSLLRFDNAKTRRGLSFVPSRHAAPAWRIIAFAFRQCQNTQRVVVRAIATRQYHAEGHRCCVSTRPRCSHRAINMRGTSMNSFQGREASGQFPANPRSPANWMARRASRINAGTSRTVGTGRSSSARSSTASCARTRAFVRAGYHSVLGSSLCHL